MSESQSDHEHLCTRRLIVMLKCDSRCSCLQSSRQAFMVTDFLVQTSLRQILSARECLSLLVWIAAQDSSSLTRRNLQIFEWQQQRGQTSQCSLDFPFEASQAGGVGFSHLKT